LKKTVPILELKPTQFAAGFLEIHEKTERARAMKPKERKKFIKTSVVPAVRSPDGELYVVDGHHLLFTLWSIGAKKIKVEIRRDLTSKKLGFKAFWKWMEKKGCFYPNDQFGEGPRNPLYLPDDIRGLADDPYRSLAWFVRKEGGFKNTDENFAEFQWANLFREHRLLERKGKKGILQAIRPALKLARSRKAKGLPGKKRK
jgi:hypothetical protein